MSAALAACLLLSACGPGSTPPPSGTAAGTATTGTQVQDRTSAVAAFSAASRACTDATGKLVAVLVGAQSAAGTDSTRLHDPALLDVLKQEISAAQAVAPCKAPTMAIDAAAIEQQVTKLNADTQAVTSAISALEAAIDAVTASAQAKAQAARHGIADIKNVDGYSWTLTWDVGTINVSSDPSLGKPGFTRVSWSADIAWTVTNTTSQKKSATPYTHFFPLYTDDLCAKYGNGHYWSCDPVAVFPQNTGMMADPDPRTPGTPPPPGSVTYYTGGDLGISEKIGSNPLPVGGTATGTVAWPDVHTANPTTFDCPDDLLQSFISELANPAGWAAVVSGGVQESWRACWTDRFGCITMNITPAMVVTDGLATLASTPTQTPHPSVRTVVAGTLTVCTAAPLDPFEYEDASAPSGYAGFDMDLTSEIADRLGLSHAVVNTDFTALESGTAMAAGRCDLAAAAVTITTARTPHVDFSDPYYEGTPGEQYGLVFAKGANPELVQAVNQALQAIRSDGTYQSIYDRYFR